MICCLVLVPLFLITLDRQQLEKNLFFQSFLYLSGKTQMWSQSFSSAIFNTVGMYLHLIHTNKENRQLTLENKQLKAKLILLDEVKQENTRLKNLMQFNQTGNWQSLFAQVIGRDPLSQYQLITLNRGKQHGVEKNMPVIAEKGFIGYVFRTQATFSQVILLTDPHSAVLAVIQRSRIQGIVEGINRNKAQLKYLKRRDDVKEGDIVVTAKTHSTLAGGFPIGRVSKITKETYGLTQKVIITPFINPSELEEVLIVTHQNPDRNPSYVNDL